jgi:hypothetical protein
MNGWTPPSRPWSTKSRLVAIALLAGAAWLVGSWPARLAELALAIGAGHAMVLALRSLAARQHRRAAGEALLSALFAGATWFALALVHHLFDAQSPC